MNEAQRIRRVAILGRPNVGKSTLFNRICGRRRALAGNEPGMTRDRIYGPAEWCGKTFEVIDTGGLALDDSDIMAGEIFSQARIAMEEASQLILVVDGREGPTPLDIELASRLRRLGKPLTLAVNKIDSNQAEVLAPEFYRLGIPNIFAISSEHARGIDDLLEHVTRDFPSGGSAPREEEETGHKAIRVAIIGRPNVGKSTLLNKIVGRGRSIVTATAGTTRDAVDAEVKAHARRFLFVDTAGIRRKGKTRLMAEKLSVVQARKHLELSDVAVLLLDAAEGVTALDAHIGGYAHESRRSVIIAVNKWDAIPKDTGTILEFTRRVRERMKYLDYGPVVFISALKGQRVPQLLDKIIEVADARRQRVGTAEMNRFLETLDFDRAPAPAGKRLRLYYLTQAAVAPPVFVAFTNQRGPLYFSVERFLANRIRERFGFLGAPITIKARLRGGRGSS